MGHLLLLLIFVATAADAPLLSGDWQVHDNIFGNESSQKCVFTLKGKELKGSCSSEQRSAAVTGEVVGKKATWRLKTNYNGELLTFEYTGTVGVDDMIVGTVTVVESGVDGEFTAARAK